MQKDLLNRYIWIVDTIKRYGRISRRQLNDCWARSPYGEGRNGIPRRTFFNYRQAIAELFSISIECDPSTYEYYIPEPQQGRITDWLLDASATSNVLQGARDIASRIMLEEVPSARQHLPSVIEAIKGNKLLQFDYQPYNRTQPSRGVTLEPYFLRIYRQLWYVTGRNTADKKVKTYSLDRMLSSMILPETFTPPEGLDPEDFFRDSFGVMVTQSKPRLVKLRVEPRQAKYFRALPLHHSQEEYVTDSCSIFTYRLRITPDFVSALLSYGPNVIVLTPPELKAMVVTELIATLDNYE